MRIAALRRSLGRSQSLRHNGSGWNHSNRGTQPKISKRTRDHGFAQGVPFRWLLMVVVCGVLWGGWGILNAQAKEVDRQTIRVAVLLDAQEFMLSVKGPYKILEGKTKGILWSGRSLGNVRVVSKDSGLSVGDWMTKQTKIYVTSQKDASISIGKRLVRGDLEIIRNANGTLTAINEIDLEDYVKGVLYHEISHRWPIEAIKAQAVATRTYALYRMATNKSQAYDVTSDIYSQVYGGKNSERYRTTMAVNRTRGEVLVYGSQILPAYFHATCAGFTEDAKELWTHDLLPLKGVPCIYCQDSPHFRWRKNFRSKTVQDQLNAKGHQLGLIQDISVVDRNVSGRIRKLAIMTRDGKQTTISGKDFRNIVGPNDIRSNNYVVEMKGYYFDLVGQGWGHGVGMCQWGARGLAARGKRYDEILKYYYPGVDLVNAQQVSY